MSKMAMEHDAINLSQGFPQANPPLQLQQLVAEKLSAGYNQYAPMVGQTALVDALRDKYYRQNLPLNAEKQITITAGATQAIFTSIQAIVEPNDKVLIFEPAYDCYEPAIKLCRGELVYHSLLAPDFSVDFDLLEKQIKQGLKLIILNNPHNPSGTCWSKEMLEQLAALLRNTETLVLSDEVYEHLMYEKQHEYALKIEGLKNRCISVHSFGKLFDCTGWKIGYAIANEQLTQEFRKVHQFNVFSVNSFVQEAIASYLKREPNYAEISSYYQNKRDFFRAIMARSRFELLDCRSTYFQLVSYEKISAKTDFAFCEHLCKFVGVAAIPISSFYHDTKQQSIIRLCFAKDEDQLQNAGQLLCQLAEIN